MDPPRLSSTEDPVNSLRFLSPPEDNSTLNYDVVIIGSGAGGSVTAAILSQLGRKRVLILEKAGYVNVNKDVSLREAHAFNMLYESGGILCSNDGSINIMAGSNVGGGTTVNWSASLRPQSWLRKEWATEHGLEYFCSESYSQAVDAVCSRIGVGTSGIVHNQVNSKMVLGCEKLGYDCETIPQNTRGHPHPCGSCGLGCSSGIKQSASRTWLKDAQDAGAHILLDCNVECVRIVDGVAKGVSAVVNLKGERRSIIVNASIVVSSAGSLHTPCLLLRSGLRNPHIGRHLGLHPVVLAFGVFPEEEINPWQGSIMTAISKVGERDHNGGYFGSKLECTTLSPGVAAAVLPWRDPISHKLDIARLRHISTILVLARDKDRTNSRIALDGSGNPEIHWGVGAHDAKTLTQGLVNASRILVAAGAREVLTTQWNAPRYVHQVGDDGPLCPNFKQWARSIRKIGVRTLQSNIFSAHQMGTCRMSTTPQRGVVSPIGETWEVKNLFVADTSLFPSPSGVNPMVTVYSLGFSVAMFILQKERIATPTSKL
jgi:choline dehydrogenase-like flavoprotein